MNCLLTQPYRAIFVVAAWVSSVGCSHSVKLPKGIRTAVDSKGFHIALDEGSGVIVHQHSDNPRTVIVANQEGQLKVLQLEPGGAIPRTMNLISANKAEFWVEIMTSRKALLSIRTVTVFLI